MPHISFIYYASEKQTQNVQFYGSKKFSRSDGLCNMISSKSQLFDTVYLAK